MRHPVNRRLPVLASGAVPVLLALIGAVPVHAQESTPAQPEPYVVALDPGHGGAPDNAHPDIPFDPGVTGVNGLVEKDVDLDVAQRTARLLVTDRVKVVMTRDRDHYLGIGARSDIANTAHASLFISIHCNSFTDPGTRGSVVLYPTAAAAPFATVMSRALEARLSADGVPADGIQLKDDLWVHTTMPSITVEGAFLTNPIEADLLTHEQFRQHLAEAIRDGIEAQAPSIPEHKRAIVAWEQARSSARFDSGLSPGGPSTPVRWTVAAAIILMAGWRRRSLLSLLAAVGRLVTGVLRGRIRRRANARRRRRRLRERGIRSGQNGRAGNRSVYDELWF